MLYLNVGFTTKNLNTLINKAIKKGAYPSLALLVGNEFNIEERNHILELINILDMKIKRCETNHEGIISFYSIVNEVTIFGFRERLGIQGTLDERINYYKELLGHLIPSSCKDYFIAVTELVEFECSSRPCCF
jgi:hypothetical protein